MSVMRPITWEPTVNWELADDPEFAARSARYLENHGLAAAEIRTALERELELQAEVAQHIVDDLGRHEWCELPFRRHDLRRRQAGER